MLSHIFKYFLPVYASMEMNQEEVGHDRAFDFLCGTFSVITYT